MIIRIVFFLLVLLSLSASAREYSSTGFFYPLKNESPNFSGCGRWLERHPPNGCYNFQDASGNKLYHTGSDMMASLGSFVYAIADGTVVYESKNGWGSTNGQTNVALLIEHRVHGSGTIFRAMYGHIQPLKSVGSQVRAGQAVGIVGNWPNGIHLHFAIIMPGKTFPLNSSYLGRWLDNKFGTVFSNEQPYYDNGFVDPIWFITHNAPDNYISRAEVSQSSLRKPIPPTNPWFPQLCANSSPPDSRCLGDDVVAYMECLYENSDLCAPRIKDYSALKGGGSGSGGAGGDSGGSYNINQDFDILNSVTGQEIIAGTKELIPGQVVKLNAEVESEGGDVRNYLRPGKDSVRVDYYYRFGGGNWIFYKRDTIQASNLGSGKKTEFELFTIPFGISEISFRIKVDAGDAVIESNESDNWSRIETFRVFYRRPLNKLLEMTE